VIIDACVFVAAYHRPDTYHTQSVAFLQCLSERVSIHAPVLLLTEVVASIMRRTHSEKLARHAGNMVQSFPGLSLHPITLEFAHDAANAALQCVVRAADAGYVALARQIKAPLITWDNELLKRAAIVTTYTPSQWLREHYA